MDKNKLRTNYIFIDYENVHPTDFTLATDYPFKVLLFVGANQTKIPIELVTSMQSLGDDAEYIMIDGSGKNALDFHIAYYLGRIIERESNSYFHIISKDTGFDILIKHLRKNKVLIQRHNKISDIPLLRIVNSKSLSDQITLTIEYLENRGNAKPRKVTTLKNAINSLFMKELSASELDSIVDELVKMQYVLVDNDKASYNLPKRI